MKLGFIGLGKMGGGMVRRLLEDGHEVVGYDVSADNLKAATEAGASSVAELIDLVGQLPRPRALWLMVPVGAPVEGTLESLLTHLSEGDVVVDGGNSNYKDTQRRAKRLAAHGIDYVDVGTSGGIWGLENGFSMMVGGPARAVELITPALRTLAPSGDEGWGHVGPSGAGHFVKMVHNGVEYGLMQAYAEGFEIMKEKTELGLDVAQIAQIWRHGSVVRSWLLDLTTQALERDRDLKGLDDWVGDSGTGRWTVTESVDLGVPAPVITLALQMRFRSQQESSFAGKLVAAMRYGFGGHAYKERPVDE